MAKKISWTPEAERTFNAVVVYLEENWSDREVINFIERGKQSCGAHCPSSLIIPVCRKGRCKGSLDHKAKPPVIPHLRGHYLSPVFLGYPPKSG